MKTGNFHYRGFASLVLVSVLTFGLAACSGGGGGGAAAPIAPLNSAQSAQFEMTVANVADVSDWQVPTSVPAPSQKPFGFGASSMPIPVKSEIQKKVFDPSVCVVTVAQPSQPSTPVSPSLPMVSATETGLSIGGASCPIAFSWSHKSNQNVDSAAQSISVTTDFAIDYKGQSSQARAFDIEAYGFKMAMAMNINQAGGSGSITGSGQIVSRSQGTIAMAINGTMQMSQQRINSTTVASLSYPNGLVVELKTISTQDPQTGVEVNTFFLNNLSISEAEFQRYSKSFGLDKAGDSKKSQKSRL